MKNQKNEYFFHILLFLFILEFINISFENKDIDYALKYRLNNGNYLFLATKGIYIYNSSFSSIKNITFDNRLINNYKESRPSRVAQFLSEDNGYIICLISNTTYFLSKNGTYLTKFVLDFIEYDNSRVTYPIIPIGHSNKEYYYLIITIKEKIIIFRKYIYNSFTNSISFDTSYSYNTNIDIDVYESIACELMYHSDKKVISCFYGSKETIYCTVFNISNLALISDLVGIINKRGKSFKSNIMIPGRQKAIISSMNENILMGYSYNIKTNEFIEINEKENSCSSDIYNLIVEYFQEREEFVYFCVGKYNISLGRISKEGQYESLNVITFSNKNCGDQHRVNLGYSSINEKYFIHSDLDCQQLFYINDIQANKNKDYPIDIFTICDNYISYNRTSCMNTIPDGFFCNDTDLKTLDKCHDNCKTCNKGLTYDNNNCLTCNNVKGYFPLIDDKDNIINNININCYNDSTIYDGYYLNSTSKYFEKCYETCKKCNDHGNIDNNKCTQCISNHNFKNDFENDSNCYENCAKFYYFDINNKYYCISNCPNDYNKLIESKKRCIDNCTKDPIYKYEYENKCIASCSPERYYNYNKTHCINTIPDGYYCNDTNLKTLDKCHDNCKKCNKGPTNGNHNCLICKESRYYDLGNCVNECENGYFKDSNNINKCKCSSNITCQFCSNENKEYNLCISCNNDEGYYPKRDDNNNIDSFLN